MEIISSLMFMRSIWKGAISFGLVNIPIRLYSASEQRYGFKMLCAKDNTPVTYKRFCEEGHEVGWNETEKGIKIGTDAYLPITKEELRAIKPEKTSYINIHQFVDSEQVDPIYFDKPYFAAPQLEKDKAYFLFQEVLAGSQKVAIGSFVMHEKEHYCVIKAYKDGLLVMTLNYADQIRDIDKIEELKEKPSIGQAERGLAKKLVEQMTTEKFDIRKFNDTFSEELKKLVRAKAAGEKIKVVAPRTKRSAKNLMEALKASVK